MRSMVAVCACLLGCTSGAPPDEEGLAMFRGDAQHSGTYEADGREGVAGLRWVFEAAGPVRSSPTVAGDLVYVGSAAGTLHAINRDTGIQVWRFDGTSSISSTPAVGYGLVFFQDRAGVVRALDRRTGSHRWEFQTGRDLPFPWGNEGWDYYVSSPTLVNGLLLVGSGDGNLYALEATTGRERWRFHTGERVRSSPAVHGGTAFVGSADGSVYAIEIANGAQRWRFDTVGRTLVSAEFGFDRRTVQSSPAVADGVVFVGARDGHVYAIDELSGEERWRFDHDVSWVITSPALADGVLYAGSSDGFFVHALDAETGRELWRTPTAANVFSSPAVVGTRLYVGDFSGAFMALDRATGEELWRFQADADVMSSPVAHDGRLYVGADDGRVYAFTGVSPANELRKAVFWDSTLVSRALYRGHESLRDGLAASGYEVLDSEGLVAFMTDGIAKGRPGVVVFAIDFLPPSVASQPSDTVLFRRFMDGSGRVVWPGYPPMAVVWEPESDDPVAVDMTRPSALLGVDHVGATFDEYPAFASTAGVAFGMPRQWIGRAGVDPSEVSRVLALEERGRAVAWIRTYGGAPGSGFVRYWARRDPMPHLGVVRRLAEGTLIEGQAP